MKTKEKGNRSSLNFYINCCMHTEQYGETNGNGSNNKSELFWKKLNRTRNENRKTKNEKRIKNADTQKIKTET